MNKLMDIAGKLKSCVVNIIIGVIKFAYGIVGKELSPKARQTWLQFAGFCFVGCTNFVVNTIVYEITLFALGGDTVSVTIGGHTFLWAKYVAIIVGFVVSVPNAYFWNNKMVFRDDEKKDHWFKVLMKTYAAYATTGIFLYYLLAWIFCDVMGIPAWIMPIINLVITTPINFFMNKLWAFNQK
ncbi:MAG: GtrA family protein [Eubacterium sp.]|nr:GtrA family protein [Eubacterium sp.]